MLRHAADKNLCTAMPPPPMLASPLPPTAASPTGAPTLASGGVTAAKASSGWAEEEEESGGLLVKGGMVPGSSSARRRAMARWTVAVPQMVDMTSEVATVESSGKRAPAKVWAMVRGGDEASTANQSCIVLTVSANTLGFAWLVPLSPFGKACNTTRPSLNSTTPLLPHTRSRKPHSSAAHKLPLEVQRFFQ